VAIIDTDVTYPQADCNTLADASRHIWTGAFTDRNANAASTRTITVNGAHFWQDGTGLNGLIPLNNSNGETIANMKTWRGDIGAMGSEASPYGDPFSDYGLDFVIDAVEAGEFANDPNGGFVMYIRGYLAGGWGTDQVRNTFPWIRTSTGASQTSLDLANRLNNGFCHLSAGAWPPTSFSCYDFPTDSSRSQCMPLFIDGNSIAVR
jgi:hypothetical protein